MREHGTFTFAADAVSPKEIAGILAPFSEHPT
jgi:hypothetical protein